MLKLTTKVSTRTSAQDFYTIAKLAFVGIPANVMQQEFRGEYSYQAELDVHFSTLTVKETLDTAAEARCSRQHQTRLGRRTHLQILRDTVLTKLGLLHASDIKAGGQNLPGLSGGERKRLSIAEVLVSSSLLQFWDNCTRGLDSINALHFLQTIRDMSHDCGSTAVVSLYQASQDLYEVSRADRV